MEKSDRICGTGRGRNEVLPRVQSWGPQPSSRMTGNGAQPQGTGWPVNTGQI